MIPQEILPYLDNAIEHIRKLKKKKKPFAVIYSERGVEVIETGIPKRR